jgi:glutathione peroxidase
VVGAKANSLYRAIAAQTGKPPRCNFHKYLLNRGGQPVAVFESAVEPDEPHTTGHIENLLAARSCAVRQARDQVNKNSRSSHRFSHLI